MSNKDRRERHGRRKGPKREGNEVDCARPGSRSGAEREGSPHRELCPIEGRPRSVCAGTKEVVPERVCLRGRSMPTESSRESEESAAGAAESTRRGCRLEFRAGLRRGRTVRPTAAGPRSRTRCSVAQSSISLRAGFPSNPTGGKPPPAPLRAETQATRLSRSH